MLSPKAKIRTSSPKSARLRATINSSSQPKLTCYFRSSKLTSSNRMSDRNCTRKSDRDYKMSDRNSKRSDSDSKKRSRSCSLRSWRIS